MNRVSIQEAADALGITKEAVYNRIRRGTLQSEVVDGERVILVESELTNKTHAAHKKPHTIHHEIAADERYIELLKSQIDELKATNDKLTEDKERLIREKEQLLIESKNALERIYKERDEQLKAILTLANRTLLAKPSDKVIDTKYEPTLGTFTSSAKSDEAQGDEGEEDKMSPDEVSSATNTEFGDWRELKSYLKARGFSKKKKKKIIAHARDELGRGVEEDEGVLYATKEKIDQLI
jgi:predicted DNA-binding protein YlxM (UPF0122 family)